MKKVLLNIPSTKLLGSYIRVLQIELEVDKDVKVVEKDDILILSILRDGLNEKIKQFQNSPDDYQMD